MSTYLAKVSLFSVFTLPPAGVFYCLKKFEGLSECFQLSSSTSDEQPSVELPIEAFGSKVDKEMESGLIKSIFDNYRLMGSRVLSVFGLREYVCGDDEQCSTLDGTALMIIHLLLVKSLTALAIAALQRNYPAKAKDYVIDKVDSLKSQFKRRASGDWEN